MTKPSKNYGFVRCDSEFEAVGQDLDMSTMGIVKGIPMYQMPDISRELMLLEEQLKFSATCASSSGTACMLAGIGRKSTRREPAETWALLYFFSSSCSHWRNLIKLGGQE